MVKCKQPVNPPSVMQAIEEQMKQMDSSASISYDGSSFPLPESMKLQPCIMSSNLSDAVLIKIEISASSSTENEEPRVREGNAMRGAQVFGRQMSIQTDCLEEEMIGSLCYVVRRPGCFFCREQALTLSMLASTYPDFWQGIRIFGVVKETVDPIGLAEFHDTYFPYPLYCDKSYAFYQALGDRRIRLSGLLHTFSLVNMLCDAYHRMSEKHVKGNFKGEGIVQGGIIIFDKHGKPFAMSPEETGKELRLKDIIAALQALRIRSQIS